MKRLFLVAAAIALTTGAFAQINSTAIQNYVEVTGTSEVTLTPDRFFVKITLDESDTKGRYDIEKQQKELISRLKKAGIDTSKQLKVDNMVSQYEKRKEAYSRASYILELDSEQAIAKVYEILDDLYISHAYLMRTECSTMDSARTKARTAAILNARTAAQELAGALGQNIGRCIYIHDHSNDYKPTNNNYEFRPMYLKSAANSQPQADSVEESIELKDIKYTYRVDAKFSLE